MPIPSSERGADARFRTIAPSLNRFHALGLGRPRVRRAQEAQGRRVAGNDVDGMRKARDACAQRISDRTARIAPGGGSLESAIEEGSLSGFEPDRLLSS